MKSWDFLVDRGDLTQTQLTRRAEPVLAEGEAWLEVERFALTANNISYGAVGESLGYWDFFPAPEGKGRIPVWGYGRVIKSNAADVPVGLRLYGYWPMSSHAVMRLEKGKHGYVEASPHRAALPAAYNGYQLAEPDVFDDQSAVLRPLLSTSLLLDNHLREMDLDAILLSSASSKTALGLAWLTRKRGVRTIGLTSPERAANVMALGLYDSVLPYTEIASLSAHGSWAYIDFAGRVEITQQVHRAVCGALALSAHVGFTHQDALEDPFASKVPSHNFFFFADPSVRRGNQSAEEKAAMFRQFAEEADWFKTITHVGPEAMEAIYAKVVRGDVSPDEGHIVRPR